MIKLFVARLLERRHYWRRLSFDELGELYTSMMLRSLGLSLVGIFVPIYLYELGYGLPVIFLFMAGLFATRFIGNPIAGYLVALVGPKHVMLQSSLAQMLALGLLLTLPQLQWPLWFIAVVWGMATSLFFISYHVDFSKIMHADHGGKELGFMAIVERGGAALGPVSGGVIATVFGAEHTIALALMLFAMAVVPLMFSAEPTRTHQKLQFHVLPYQQLKRDFFTFAMMGAETQTSVAIWPLFLAVAVLTSNVYASVGLATSVGVIATIFAARFIGQLIDRQQGGQLLRWAASTNALLHLIRPFIGSMGGVLLMNVTQDGVATGYRLAYTKGMYARADELAGMRIVYIVVMEIMGDAGKTGVWLIAWLLCLWVQPSSAMEISFVVGAVASLLIMTQQLPGLRRRRLAPVELYS